MTGRDLTTIERMQCGALSGLFAQTLTVSFSMELYRISTFFPSKHCHVFSPFYDPLLCVCVNIHIVSLRSDEKADANNRNCRH